MKTLEVLAKFRATDLRAKKQDIKKEIHVYLLNPKLIGLTEHEAEHLTDLEFKYTAQEVFSVRGYKLLNEGKKKKCIIRCILE